MYYNLLSTKLIWRLILADLVNKHSIEKKIIYEHQLINRNLAVLPNPDLVFSAFNHFDLEDLKVVIIGQDPYINEDQAMGLSFSIPEGVKLPPSLKNIYKCIENTLNCNMNYQTGNLTKWAEQGVLLLNTTLTVFERHSNSHKKIWKGFSLDLLKYISDNTLGVVFLLWGNEAKKLKSTIDIDKHHILEHTHPSPLSRKSFIDCDHFIKTNELLRENETLEIDWQI
jgi:uracil-DNA glycosylase|tara:strand:+ start:484 stop:1161 length:678 start_codon:yes stop_codon:yes gene_type:complete